MVLAILHKSKLGFAALAFIDAEVSADSEISGRKLQKRLQEKQRANVSISLINRQRRRMGWIQTRVLSRIQSQGGVTKKQGSLPFPVPLPPSPPPHPSPSLPVPPLLLEVGPLKTS